MDTRRRRVFGYPVLTMDEIRAIHNKWPGVPILEDHFMDAETHTVEVVAMRYGGLPCISELEALKLTEAVNTLAKYIQPAKRVPYEGVR